MNSDVELAVPKRASPVRVIFMSLTIVSLGLLFARKFGFAIPKPLVLIGWLIIELKILLKLKEIFELLMARRRDRLRGSGLSASKPSLFIALIMVESRLLAAFFASFRRTSDRAEGFTFSKAPEYQTFGYVLWFSVLVEVPFVFLLAHIVPSIFIYRFAIELILALVSVYALMAFRADRSSIHRTAHEVTPENLKISLGIRVSGVIPLANVLSVEAIPPGGWRVWADGCRKRCLTVAKVSPLDKPNVAIFVSPGWGHLSWMHGGFTVPDVVALYVDDRNGFLRALLRVRANAKPPDDAVIPPPVS